MHVANDRSSPVQDQAEPSIRDKIKTVADLGQIAVAARAAGRTVVLADGSFNFLHLGRVRTLEEARRKGDVLMVSVSADLVAKDQSAPPGVSAPLRAEMLAAIACVDWVAINTATSIDDVIEAVQPDVYVDGSEFADSVADALAEPSTLLEHRIDVSNPELHAYLRDLREHEGVVQLLEMLDGIEDMHVLLVGDTIIDEYHYVCPLGKSPKENLIATLSSGREMFAGGIIAAANHVAGFCRQVDVVTCLGEQDSFEDLVRSSLRPNVGLTALRRPDVPTTRKRRYVDTSYMRKLFEVYHMDDSPLSGELEESFVGEIEKRCADVDIVVVADFGHGLVTDTARRALIEHSPFLAVNAQSNSANHGFNLITRYARADYICIDAPEARLAVADKVADLTHIADTLLPARIDCPKFILTHGHHGCVTYDHDHGTRHIPAFTQRVLDTMGAGDAFLAITAPLVAAGNDIELVGAVGNAVGALKVGILGHRESVDKAALVTYLKTLLR